jgi:hypothetical protein
MTTKSLSLLLALAIVCTLTPPVIAQESAAGRGWPAVQALASGTKLRVRMKSGETVEGRLDTVFDAGLTLSRRGGTITLSRDAIQKAYRVGGRQVGKSTLMGLGIGAGIGAAAGGAEAVWGGPHESGEAAMPVFVFAAGGAIIGTTAGLVVGLFRRKKVLVYESM